MCACRSERLEIEGIQVLVPDRFRDARGFFSETHSDRMMRDAGIDATFVQENHSLSVAEGVVRGLHFQSSDFAQGKLVRVVRGSILDIAVDIRTGSPSYGRHVRRVLSADNWEQLWIPVGFAHGFCTLEPNCEVLYKVTAPYAPELSHSLLWNDPALAIDWPVAAADAILSPKDADAPTLAELAVYFTI
jgi:dTDP-4-dehydrorhamnose 3,5-epimerase